MMVGVFMIIGEKKKKKKSRLLLGLLLFFRSLLGTNLQETSGLPLSD